MIYRFESELGNVVKPQEPTTEPVDEHVLPSKTRIGRTALRVSNLGEMTDFYREIVGLHLLERAEGTSVLGAAGTPLLVLEHDEEALDRHRTGAGLYHNAFRVPSRGALGDALARVREYWQLGGASDHGVSEALYLTDPEGNGIEIYRDFPREEWPVTDDGRLQLPTRPLDLDPIAGAATGESDLPAGTDVGHVHLEVTSLDAFRELYVETLGFEVQTEVRSAAFVSAGGYHHHVAANTWHRRTNPVRGRGLAWFELLVPDAAALEAVRRRVVDSRFTVEEAADGIVVTDGDGIEVQFRLAD